MDNIKKNANMFRKIATQISDATGICYDDVCAVLAIVPRIDVQEVVRCKDCMYYYKAVECQEYYCGKAIGLVEANFDSFCSYGKKMEGDSNA